MSEKHIATQHPPYIHDAIPQRQAVGNYLFDEGDLSTLHHHLLPIPRVDLGHKAVLLSQSATSTHARQPASHTPLGGAALSCVLPISSWLAKNGGLHMQKSYGTLSSTTPTSTQLGSGTWRTSTSEDRLLLATLAVAYSTLSASTCVEAS